jgi:murein DD-endopeptidase MepM/ murein hydrolase activator NlpD
MANEVRIIVKATDHTGPTFANIDRKVRTTFSARMKTAFYGVGLSSGLSFTSGLLNGISFGRLGGGLVARLRPHAALWGAKAGTGMGAALGAAVLVQASNVLAAGLPLILGLGLTAGPLAWLAGGEGRAKSKLTSAMKRRETLQTQIANPHTSETARASARWKLNNRVNPEIEELREQSTRVARLKRQTVGFMDTISKPLQTPFTKMLQEIAKGMERLEGPMVRMMKGIGPALAPFTKGVMGLLTEFVKALEPRMPTIAEGMKAWGEAAPKIGKGLGDFLAKLMKDPEGTVQALEDLGKALSDLASASVTIVTQLGDAAAAYGRFADKVDEYENRLDSKGGPLKAMWSDLVFFKGKFEQAFDSFRAWIEPKLENLGSMMRSKAKSAVTGVRNWFGKLPAWLSNSTGEMTDRLKLRWNEAKSAVSERARGVYNAVVSRLRSIPAWVGRNAKEATDRLKQRWSEARTEVTRRVRALADNVTNTLRALPGRISRALSGAKAAVLNRFAGARTWLSRAGGNVIRGLLDGMKAPWTAVKNWVSGIAKWIKANKGPIELDRRLLFPAGKALMGGLLGGLKFGFGPVGSFVYKAGGKIADTIGKIKGNLFGGGGPGGSFLGGQMPMVATSISRHSGYRGYAADFNRGSGADDYGDPVRAWRAGVVTSTPRWGHSYGNHIRLFHGLARTLYAHLSAIFVKPGQFVKASQTIGAVGTSGNSSGPHLHFEKYAKGGWINEPVVGVGQRSGKGYMFGEAGRELVTPEGQVGGGAISAYFNIDGAVFGPFFGKMMREHDRAQHRRASAGNNGGL